MNSISWCKYKNPDIQAQSVLCLSIDEVVEKQQRFLVTFNVTSPFDISPIPNTKKHKGTRIRKAANSRLVVRFPIASQGT